MTKESQNRYLRLVKTNLREFVTLNGLFDQHSKSGSKHSEEVLIVKDTSIMLKLPKNEFIFSSSDPVNETRRIMNRGTFTWQVETSLLSRKSWRLVGSSTSFSIPLDVIFVCWCL